MLRSSHEIQSAGKPYGHTQCIYPTRSASTSPRPFTFSFISLAKCWPSLTACSRRCAASKLAWSGVHARVLHYVCQEGTLKSANFSIQIHLPATLISNLVPCVFLQVLSGTVWLAPTGTLGRISSCLLFSLSTSSAGCATAQLWLLDTVRREPGVWENVFIQGKVGVWVQGLYNHVFCIQLGQLSKQSINPVVIHSP